MRLKCSLPYPREYSWLRVKINGNVVGDVLGNTSYNNLNLPVDPLGGNTVLSYDLSSYAGDSYYITFESVNKYGTGSGAMNNVWLDNLNLSLGLISGCIDSLALNYNPFAQVDDGSCMYDIYGCTDTSASNYDSLATLDNGSCLYDIYGCTDTSAFNYNPLATIDDSSCIITIYGCTDSTALNYDSLANVDDGSCMAPIYGCTDPGAINYYAGATSDDGSCIYAGCTDTNASNYNPNATIDDGSCIYWSCTDPSPDGLGVNWITDTKAEVIWGNMNDSSCMVWKYYVRYRAVGDPSWTTKSAGVGNGLCNFGLNTVTKQLLNLTPSTTYEFKMKAFLLRWNII